MYEKIFKELKKLYFVFVDDDDLSDVVYGLSIVVFEVIWEMVGCKSVIEVLGFMIWYVFYFCICLN